VSFESCNYLHQMFKLHFFSKESKGMHKVIQLISNYLYNKNMPPYMKVHVHYMILMKNQIIQKIQSLEILKERATRKRTHFYVQ